MSGECKMLKTEWNGVIYMSSGSKMLTETCLMNYRHDRRMSGQCKTLSTETSLMNMPGACRVEVKC